jgi:hypothetical protein
MGRASLWLLLLRIAPRISVDTWLKGVNPSRLPATLSRLAGRVAVDSANDLALLKSDTTKPKKVVAIRSSVRLGEPVEAFGYPLVPVLSRNGNFTLGNITALAGVGDDSRYVQISAPVQKGNSGGPLLDQNGNVVGVVAAKMDAMKVAAVVGDLPQNVNFAIKGGIAASFLESNRIAFRDVAALSPISAADLADLAKEVSISVQCRP